MQINLNPRYNISFKQIVLSNDEFENGKKTFYQLTTDPESSECREKLFDIFESHLNKEVELKDFKEQGSKRFFSTYMYTKFFNTLENVLLHNGSFGDLIFRLNAFSKYFTEKPLTDVKTETETFNVSDAEKLTQDFCNYLGITKNDFIKKNQRYPILRKKNVEELKKDVDFVVENLGFNQEEYLQILLRNSAAFFRSGSEIVDSAKNTMKTLKIDNIEDFRALVSTNPALLTPHELVDRIKIIAEFLDADEESVITAIKNYSLLATYKIDDLKSNFYAMKDYLKLDREQMSKLSLLNTSMLTNTLERNKMRYESIASVLGLSTDAFIKKANSLPTIHLMNPAKLESYLTYLSEKLGYTREGTIEYVFHNLNVLSYKFNNIIQRTAENGRILKEELKIDDDTYKSMLIKNSCIFGARSEFIKQNIGEACEYFNVDKSTYAKMIASYPRILTAYVVTIDNNITELANVLNIDKEDYKKLCIKEPNLVIRTPEFFAEDVASNAELLKMSKEDFVSLARKNPFLLTKRFNNIREIEVLMNKKNS